MSKYEEGYHRFVFQDENGDESWQMRKWTEFLSIEVLQEIIDEYGSIVRIDGPFTKVKNIHGRDAFLRPDEVGVPALDPSFETYWCM